MNDPIKPSHYHDVDGSNINCHHAQLSQMGIEYMIGYHWGNIIKYVWRWERKNGIEDLKKAAQHISMLTKLLEESDHGGNNDGSNERTNGRNDQDNER